MKQHCQKDGNKMETYELAEITIVCYFFAFSGIKKPISYKITLQFILHGSDPTQLHGHTLSENHIYIP